MALETFIGWRYLKAKREQTFISIITFISLAGVALGVSALIVVLAVMSGLEKDMRDKILGLNSHVVVLKKNSPMDDYQSLIQKIEKVDGVSFAEPFVLSQVMMSSANGVRALTLRGVDPEISVNNSDLVRIVRSGKLEYLKDDGDYTGPAVPGVILGSELAGQMHVFIGDRVKIVSPMGKITPLGGRVPSIRDFMVVGILESGLYEYDSKMGVASIGQAQSFLNLGGSITGIDVKVDDVYKADRIKRDILKSLGDTFKAKDWMELNSSLFAALKLEKIAMFIILTLTVLVATFNIVSTLMMVVMEKTRDIAILKSMGATRSNIMKIFIFQGFFIGLVGTVVGLVLGVVLCQVQDRFELVKLPGDVYYNTSLSVIMNPLEISFITFSALLISLLATMYPAWQASRLNPVEALRYE